MNKKIILPLAVAAMGFASCNNGVALDAAAAAAAAADAFEATINDIGNNNLKLSVNIGKADIDVAPTTKASINVNLSNTKATVELAAKDFGSENLTETTVLIDGVSTNIVQNNYLKARLKLSDVNLNGDVNVTATTNEEKTTYNLASFENIGGFTGDLYINKLKGDDDLGLYRVIGSVSKNTVSELDKVLNSLKYASFAKLGIDDLYVQIAETILMIDNAIGQTQGDDYNGGYLTISKLIDKSSNINTNAVKEKTAEEAVSQVFGELAEEIGEGQLLVSTEEAKKEITEDIQAGIEEIQKKFPSINLSMIQKGNSLSIGTELSAENLNTIIKEIIGKDEGEYDIFKSGSVSISLSSDDSKHISHFSVSANQLKTDDIEASKKFAFKLNELTCSLSADLSYYDEDTIGEVLGNVPTALTDYVCLDDIL